MKLLIASTVSSTIRAFLFPYADHFRSLGWKVDALAAGIADCTDSPLHFDQLHDVNWSRRAFDHHNLTSALSRVRQVIADGDYDIIHVHTPIAAFVSRLALAGLPSRKRPALVYTVHGFHFQSGNNVFSNVAFAALEKLAGRWTDHLITMNREDDAAARRLRIVPAERMHCIPGVGIDIGFFRPAAVPSSEVDRVRRGFGIGPDDPVFAMVAEFIPRKCHRDAVAALARLSHPNAHMIFVGEGRELDPVRTFAAEAGVLNRIHFAGNQNDVRPFILAALATILPSTQEGLPRSIMESFACGVPVIASDIRGNRDLLAEGGGLLFPAGDIESLASRMNSLAADPAGAAQMGAIARTAVARYDIANVIRLHEELYAEVMRGAVRSVRPNVLVRGAR